MDRRLRIGVLAGLGVVLAWLGVRATITVARQARIAAACEALSAGDPQPAAALPLEALSAAEDGPIAIECHCRALFLLGRGEVCRERLRELAPSPEAVGAGLSVDTWVTIVEDRRHRGETRLAAALLARAREEHPDSLELGRLEIVLAPDDALADLAPRLAGDTPEKERLRLFLAQRVLRLGDGKLVLRLLAEPPRLRDPEHLRSWYWARGQAIAGTQDLAALNDNYAEWVSAGGDRWEALAHHTVALAMWTNVGPEVERMRALALEHFAELPKGVATKLALMEISYLLNQRRFADAIAMWDRATARGLSLPYDRESLASASREAAVGPGGSSTGTLVFVVPPDLDGGSVLVSPDPGAPVDADFDRYGIAGTRLEIPRRPGDTPSRWVALDARGQLRGSGAVRFARGDRIEIAIVARPPRPPPPPPDRERRPADGRRRVLVVIPDCGDWRLVQYLRARGELPVLDAQIRAGFRAVLHSSPPFTGRAMQSLAFPSRRTDLTLAQWVYELGGELGGLASVGRNPFEGLKRWLPIEEDISAVVGRGEKVAANMLFSHAYIDAGRHATITGPQGRTRELRMAASARPLRPDERSRFPGLGDYKKAVGDAEIRMIAAQLDAIVEIAAKREIDFLLFRVEPLDLITHSHFHEIDASTQDDGRGYLLEAYRYLDHRLAEVERELDRDDVLVVVSDHGILTPLAHDPNALFVATGAHVPAGRAPGRPDFRGVPRTLADLLGVETAWPREGLEIPLGGAR